MKRDPLEAVRLIDEAVVPRQSFANELEDKMRRALDVLFVPVIDGNEEATMATRVTSQTISTGIPYADVGQAIRWLTQVFGLRVSKYWGPAANPMYAYLVWHNRNSIQVYVRPPKDNAWSVVGPVSIGLLEPDEDAINRAYERAVALGADVVRELQRQSNPAVPGGYLGFTLRDPEGNLWSLESVHGQID